MYNSCGLSILEFVLNVFNDPGNDSDVRASAIRGMFSRIAPRYDLINSVLSFMLHGRWRKYAVSRAGLKNGNCALDVCCGTGDFAFELAGVVGPDGCIEGVDFCDPMLEIARSKAVGMGLTSINFSNADAINLPFKDCEFDCVTIGFGLRNITRPEDALREMLRVLSPGGRFVCLEASRTKLRLASALWRVYFCKLSPLIAWMFGGDIGAYRYLPESVMGFYTREELIEVLGNVGFTDVSCHDLAFGAACLHLARKPQILD